MLARPQVADAPIVMLPQIVYVDQGVSGQVPRRARHSIGVYHYGGGALFNHHLIASSHLISSHRLISPSHLIIASYHQGARTIHVVGPEVGVGG
jgi:hypothetical protein